MCKHFWHLKKVYSFICTYNFENEIEMGFFLLCCVFHLISKPVLLSFQPSVQCCLPQSFSCTKWDSGQDLKYFHSFLHSFLNGRSLTLPPVWGGWFPALVQQLFLNSVIDVISILHRNIYLAKTEVLELCFSSYKIFSCYKVCFPFERWAFFISEYL